ncbi:MAG: hypothetical protein ABSE21_08815 [Bryobacteraceae bacterium]
MVRRDHAAAILKPVNRALNLRRGEVVQPGFTEVANQVLGKVLVSLERLRRQPPAGVLFEPIPNVLRECRINLRRRLLGSGTALHRNGERGDGRALVAEAGLGLVAQDVAPRHGAEDAAVLCDLAVRFLVVDNGIAQRGRCCGFRFESRFERVNPLAVLIAAREKRIAPCCAGLQLALEHAAVHSISSSPVPTSVRFGR